MARYVTHLESAIDGTHFAPDALHTMHAGRPLWVRYDLEQVRRRVTREDWERRAPDLWRFRELLPTGDAIAPVSLGEEATPLLACPRLGRELGLAHLWIKDESHLPTGSFKARGLAMAVTMARHFGVRHVALPTAGNAGSALAAYAARAGMAATVFMPADTPRINQVECHLAGARTWLVDGLIHECGKLVREGQQRCGWFDCSTLKEPYRLEGKKTMGLELALQRGWRLPDVILYPTGGGTGLVGMWKAFDELRQLGWLADERLPRMVAVQAAGCAPIVRAFEQGERFAEPWTDAATIATGLRVPAAVGDFMILDAVRHSGGTAVAIDEAQIVPWMRRAATAEGVSICPETATCVAAAHELARTGWLGADEEVVIFNTASAAKYPEAVTVELPRCDKESPDWPSIVGER